MRNAQVGGTSSRALQCNDNRLFPEMWQACQVSRLKSARKEVFNNIEGATKYGSVPVVYRNPTNNVHTYHLFSSVKMTCINVVNL
jgi:hypothetical protein